MRVPRRRRPDRDHRGIRQACRCQTQNRYDHHAGEQVSGKYRWLTLDDLIDLASSEKAEKVRVIWPDGQTYPRAVDVDYNVNTADDEVSYLIYHVSTGAT